jgi:FHS family L-fucose permease-like MFS transporter
MAAQVSIWSYFIDYTKDLMPTLSERAAGLLSLSFALFMGGWFMGAALMARIAPERLLLVHAVAAMALVGVGMGRMAGWRWAR